MICRSCGAANSPEAVTCRVCGRPPSADPTRISQAGSGRVPPPQVLRPPSERPTPTGPPTSPWAVAALAAGIAAWTLAPVIGSILAIVFGHRALREIEASGGAIDGRGLAVAGLIFGYVQLAVAALVLLGVCVFFAVTFLLIQSAAIAS